MDNNIEKFKGLVGGLWGKAKAGGKELVKGVVDAGKGKVDAVKKVRLSGEELVKVTVRERGGMVGVWEKRLKDRELREGVNDYWRKVLGGSGVGEVIRGSAMGVRDLLVLFDWIGGLGREEKVREARVEIVGELENRLGEGKKEEWRRNVGVVLGVWRSILGGSKEGVRNGLEELVKEGLLGKVNFLLGASGVGRYVLGALRGVVMDYYKDGDMDFREKVYGLMIAMVGEGEMKAEEGLRRFKEGWGEWGNDEEKLGVLTFFLEKGVVGKGEVLGMYDKGWGVGAVEFLNKCVERKVMRVGEMVEEGLLEKEWFGEGRQEQDGAFELLGKGRLETRVGYLRGLKGLSTGWVLEFVDEELLEDKELGMEGLEMLVRLKGREDDREVLMRHVLEMGKRVEKHEEVKEGLKVLVTAMSPELMEGLRRRLVVYMGEGQGSLREIERMGRLGQYKGGDLTELLKAVVEGIGGGFVGSGREKEVLELLNGIMEGEELDKEQRRELMVIGRGLLGRKEFGERTRLLRLLHGVVSGGEMTEEEAREMMEVYEGEEVYGMVRFYEEWLRDWFKYGEGVMEGMLEVLGEKLVLGEYGKDVYNVLGNMMMDRRELWVGKYGDVGLKVGRGLVMRGKFDGDPLREMLEGVDLSSQEGLRLVLEVLKRERGVFEKGVHEEEGLRERVLKKVDFVRMLKGEEEELAMVREVVKGLMAGEVALKKEDVEWLMVGLGEVNVGLLLMWGMGR